MGLQEFYSHGKLLLSGEYIVLDGALSLAIPTRFGQKLKVETISDEHLHWESLDEQNTLWFEASFTSELKIINTSDPQIANTLQQILKETISQNPIFKTQLSSTKVTTTLEFNRKWGLGSSSTLIHLISQWSQTDPYLLLQKSFGGSGYDIACASSNNAITYQLINQNPKSKACNFKPSFYNQLFFVYLDQKQVSKSEIKKYAEIEFDRQHIAKEISRITEAMVDCKTLPEFQSLMDQHETILANVLSYPKVKDVHFTNIQGSFKSLGAWGGDFVLFAGDRQEIEKIKALGFQTILTWNEMVNPI